jgi:hypothetical protein
MQAIDYLNQSILYENVNSFEGLLQNRMSKILTILFSFLSVPFIVALFYGIVWYERFGTDNKRTLINKLLASQCWAFIQYFIICQTVDTIGLLVKGLSSSICFAQVILKNSYKTQFLLFFDSSIFVQYLFIFRVKNPAAVNDDFWSHLVSMWIAGFSFIFNFSKFYIAHRQPINYYICIATLPELDWSLPTHFGAHIEILTIITIIVIKLKIHYFRSNLVEDTMTKRSIFLKNFSLEAINRNSMSSFSTNFTGVLIMSTFVFFGLKLNRMNPTQLNEYPNYFYVYFSQLILPNLVGFIVIGIFYSKNTTMRATFFSELNNGFECPL